MQQYQEISQANESALAALNATHDEYKASTEAQIAKYEVRIYSSGATGLIDVVHSQIIGRCKKSFNWRRRNWPE